MSAEADVDTIRRASQLMRERARKATPGPWEVGDWWHIQASDKCECERYGQLAWQGVRDINGTEMHAHIHRSDSPIDGDVMQADASDGYPLAVTVGNDHGDAANPCDAAYIAAMHPGVALAVADLLDKIARQHRKLTGDACGQGYLPTGEYGYVDPSCSHCGNHDEYAQPWPCEPINDALAIARAYQGDNQ